MTTKVTPAASSAAMEEPMKRLTLDVPASLHRKIKTACAARGSKMADELRALLEAHYANQ